MFICTANVFIGHSVPHEIVHSCDLQYNQIIKIWCGYLKIDAGGEERQGI